MRTFALINMPELKTFAHSEVWSPEPFTARMWWDANIPAEEKGDIHGIHAKYRIEVPAQAWVYWSGTHDGVERLDFYAAAAPSLFEVKPGVNLVLWMEEEPEEPPTPTPTPSPTPIPIPLPPLDMPPFTGIWGDEVPRLLITFWGSTDMVMTVPQDWYTECWEAIKATIIRRITEAIQRGEYTVEFRQRG